MFRDLLISILMAGVVVGCEPDAGEEAGEGGREDEGDVPGAVEEGSPSAETGEEDAQQQVAQPLDCEQQGYPCSWAEVDPAVAERSRVVGEEGLDRVLDESPTETVGWLRSQEDVAEAGATADSAALWFRMEGGRRVYIEGRTPAPLDVTPMPAANDSGPPSGGAPNIAGEGRTGADLRRAGLLDVFMSAFPSSAFPRRSSSARSEVGGNAVVGPKGPPARVRVRGVAGRDRNQDSEVDQRDQRRALVLDPLHWEFCYESLQDGLTRAEERRLRDRIVAVCEGEETGEDIPELDISEMYDEGAVVKAELEASNVYWQNVTLLKNGDVDFATVSSWPEYDVIHLATHGDSRGWTFGEEVLWPRNGEWSSVPRTKGLEIWWVRAGEVGPKKAVYGAELDFFRTALPQGLHRSMLFINACNGLGSSPSTPTPLNRHLIRGSSMFIGWSMSVGTRDAVRAAKGLYDVMSRGWSGEQALDSLPDEVRAPPLQNADGDQLTLGDLLLAGHGFLGRQGADLRVQEIPELLHPRSVLLGMDPFPLQDGGDLVTLLDGLPGDGEEDRLSVMVDVVAVTREEAPRTSVHLELDGKMIGEPEELSLDEEVDFETFRKEFRDVPLELDVQPGEEYELAAVVEPVEGGESRYGARLMSEECSVPLGGYFEGNAGGAAARRVEAKAQNSAKILARSHAADPSGTGQPPLGEWHLRLQSGANKGGDDFDLHVYVPDPIEPGRPVAVTDVGLVHGAVTGGVSEPEDLTWLAGTVRILFTGIDESPGSGEIGVCGDISADITGGKEPPPGVMGFVEVPVSFNGKFRAVWRKE
jgi:hypothetical protein